MQTFLPYADFEESAKVLDVKRLGKQRIETKQILQTLLGRSHGWKNHPAVRMWQGYEAALAIYGDTICDEWIRRGYEDHQKPIFQAESKRLGLVCFPPWLGLEEFHSSHRAALLQKNPNWYGRFGWKEVPIINYCWPIDFNIG